MKNLLIIICFFIITNLAKADEWRLQAGNARDIAVGANGAVWSIGNTPTDGSYNIQRWTGTSWQNIDGGGKRIAVDPNGNPWVINSANQIFKREANRWVQMPGTAIDIGIGANGDVWVIGTDDNIIGGGGKRVYKLVDNNWRVVEGGGVKITVGPNGQPFIVNNGGTIYERLTTGNWQTYPGQAYDISIGANGSLWAIGRISKGGGSYSIHKWNVDIWEEVDGGGTEIAVDATGKPWITNHLNEIYKRNYTTPVYRSVITVSPIAHDYPFTGAPSCIAANPSNQYNLLIASGSGGVYETTNALSSTRTWTYNNTLTNPNIYDLVFTTSGAPFTALAAAGETFKVNATTPQIWQKNSSGIWSLARFVAGTNIPSNKTSCYRVIKGSLAGTYYACGDFGIAFYGPTLSSWEIIPFPTTVPVYSIAALQNGIVAAATEMGTYIYSPSTRVWTKRNDAAKVRSSQERYRLNTDFSGQIIMYADLAERYRNATYTADGLTWGTFNLPPEYTDAAGGFESVYLDSVITGNYSIFISNKYKFYQANLYGTSPLAGLDYLRNNNQPLQWSEPIQPGHDDTRHFLRLRSTDGTNKIVMTSDGGFHISNFSYATVGGYHWQTERTSSGLNNLEVYNLAGTYNEVNFGTQHNSLAALNATFAIAGPALALGEGYVINRNGMGDVDKNSIIFDNKYGLSIQGPAFGKPAVNVCGTSNPFWISPSAGWGNPIWLGNKMYIQDARPADATPAVFPWRISMDNGCTWQPLPNGNSIRKGMNAFFSVRNNIEQNLFVGLQGSGSGVKLGKLVNPHIRSLSNWVYPAMTGLEGGIPFLGAEFLYNPIFCVNPSNPENLFAIENNTGKLKFSNNGGNNWAESTSFTQALTVINTSAFKGSKNSFSIRSMSFSPFDSNLILIGTVSEGLYKSNDGGTTWQRIQTPGLYNITDFHWRTTNTVIISTYGHGLFSMNM